jgi:hypothetical protein
MMEKIKNLCLNKKIKLIRIKKICSKIKVEKKRLIILEKQVLMSQLESQLLKQIIVGIRVTFKYSLFLKIFRFRLNKIMKNKV